MRQRELPAHLQELFGADAIRAGIAPVAESVGAWCAGVLERSGEQALAVCVLRGGVFFFSDLLQRVPVTVEPAFCRCASYAKDENDSPDPRVEVELHSLSLAGRSVLLVDNICDSGRTLRALTERCMNEGAFEVRAVTLIRRVRDDAVAQPDWQVFDVRDSAWLAGYGMRDCDQLMNYPAVYRIAE